eukprot:1277299-Pyramimonas_sp.AAC.1
MRPPPSWCPPSTVTHLRVRLSSLPGLCPEGVPPSPRLAFATRTSSIGLYRVCFLSDRCRSVQLVVPLQR